jgi:hypothetical protein
MLYSLFSVQALTDPGFSTSEGQDPLPKTGRRSRWPLAPLKILRFVVGFVV